MKQTLPCEPHRSTSSTRLPSGSARNAKRTPGSGEGRGETCSVAPAASALAEQRRRCRARRGRSARTRGSRAPRSACPRAGRRPLPAPRRAPSRPRRRCSITPRISPSDELELDASKPKAARVEVRRRVEVADRQAGMVEPHPITSSGPMSSPCRNRPHSRCITAVTSGAGRCSAAPRRCHCRRAAPRRSCAARRAPDRATQWFTRKRCDAAHRRPAAPRSSARRARERAVR